MNLKVQLNMMMENTFNVNTKILLLIINVLYLKILKVFYIHQKVLLVLVIPFKKININYKNILLIKEVQKLKKNLEFYKQDMVLLPHFPVRSCCMNILILKKIRQLMLLEYINLIYTIIGNLMYIQMIKLIIIPFIIVLGQV